MKRTLLGGLAALVLASLAGANPALAGHWRMDPAQSAPLDGWHKMDLVIGLEGSQVAITHRMQWRSTKLEATNTFDTAQPVSLAHMFRVEQRHMAVYPARSGVTHATAAWLDGGRTLRIAAEMPVEVSQGDTVMRIYSEYRLGELGDTLTLIELHASRNAPLVYVFHRINAEEGK
jgi:hypothetical protein